MLSRSIVAVLFAFAVVGCRERIESPGIVPSLVLTDSACADVGLGATVTSHLKVILINRTTDRMLIDVLRVREPHAFVELAALVADDQRRVQARQTLQGPLSVADRLQARMIGPSAEEAFDEDLVAGTYAFVCSRATGQVSVDGKIVAIYLAGPFKVP